MIRRHVIVRGLVQGVFFRDSTRRVAQRYDVTGWVSNRADGAVEAVFEGNADAVERLVAFSREGTFRLLSGDLKIYIKTSESGSKRPQSFCPECGTAYSAKKKCGSCGHEAEGSPKFCPECGGKY